MNTYLIGYDLLKEEGNQFDYTELKKAIMQIAHDGLFWHCLDSTWLIKSNSTSLTITNFLRTKIDDNDKLFVAQLQSHDVAWTGFNDKCSNWLSNYLTN